MRIAIASGKGGAGKTTVTASLHSVWPRRHALADADVEAPNLHIFLHPVVESLAEVSISVPASVQSTCTACGKCRDICRFGAIAQFRQKIALFSDMCHGCGGCFAVCPEHALLEGKRTLGTVETGHLENGTRYVSGTTRIGEVMTPPVLRRLLDELETVTAGTDLDILIDSPPGVSCPAVTVARRVDAVLLVVDPTPFGYFDFRIAWEAFRSLGLPLAVVINRSGMIGNDEGDKQVKAFCLEHGLPLVGEIPFSHEAACAAARGGLLTDISPAWKSYFREIANKTLHCFEEDLHV